MSPLSARILVFSTSAAVLVLEILAGRLLAPYVGVTLETFTAIIGTVLAGIAIGAWLGGRAADRRPPDGLLGPLLIAGGLLSLLAPTVVEIFGPRLRGGEPLEIVVLTALAFLLPAVILSAVTPVVVKLRLSDLSETGTVVGRYSAIGTAGAIFGTFFTGFVLLAASPTRPIILGVGALLVLFGLSSLRSRRPAVVIATAVAVALAGGAMAVASGPCDAETTYFCARVEVDSQRLSGRILWLDTLRHSYVDLEDPTHLEFRYTRLIADVIVAEAPPGPLEALYIGGGGFTMPRWLSVVRPGSSNTVLELDGGLVDISEDRLGLDRSEIDTIVVGDARVTLGTTPRGGFDLIVGDAFSGVSVPWHLTTREFLEEVRERLRPGGIYVMNVIDRPPNDFVKAEVATLREVFKNTLVLAPPAFLDDDAGGNFVLVAADGPLDAEVLNRALRSRDAASVAFNGGAVETWMAGAVALRDDYAPVDQLLSRP